MFRSERLLNSLRFESAALIVEQRAFANQRHFLSHPNGRKSTEKRKEVKKKLEAGARRSRTRGLSALRRESRAAITDPSARQDPCLPKWSKTPITCFMRLHIQHCPALSSTVQHSRINQTAERERQRRREEPGSGRGR
ncbi:hypothetical protein MHYP_G00237310 [Metynnis hypsauchen]